MTNNKNRSKTPESLSISSQHLQALTDRANSAESNLDNLKTEIYDMFTRLYIEHMNKSVDF